VSAVEQDEYGRPETPLAGSEVETLLGFLDYQRATLAWKCAGLDDDQLRRALFPTSLSLAGMLKHLMLIRFAPLGSGCAAARLPPQHRRVPALVPR